MFLAEAKNDKNNDRYRYNNVAVGSCSMHTYRYLAIAERTRPGKVPGTHRVTRQRGWLGMLCCGLYICLADAQAAK